MKLSRLLLLLRYKSERSSPVVFELYALTVLFWLKVLIKTIGMYHKCQFFWYHRNGRLMLIDYLD